MDKDKGNQPPMPKLPEPNDAAPPLRKEFFSRRERVIIGIGGGILLAAAVLFITVLLQSNRTAKQVVDAWNGGELAVQEEIVAVSLPGDSQRQVYFFVSDDQLACAILARGINGYRVEDASGQLRLSSTGNQGIWKMLGKDFFVFGLIYDETVKNVQVNGQNAVVVDNGLYRCWFYYSQNGMSINSESVVYEK